MDKYRLELSSSSARNSTSPVHFQTSPDRRTNRSHEPTLGNYVTSLRKEGSNRLVGMARRFTICIQQLNSLRSQKQTCRATFGLQTAFSVRLFKGTRPHYLKRAT